MFDADKKFGLFFADEVVGAGAPLETPVTTNAEAAREVLQNATEGTEAGTEAPETKTTTEKPDDEAPSWFRKYKEESDEKLARLEEQLKESREEVEPEDEKDDSLPEDEDDEKPLTAKQMREMLSRAVSKAEKRDLQAQQEKLAREFEAEYNSAAKQLAEEGFEGALDSNGNVSRKVNDAVVKLYGMPGRVKPAPVLDRVRAAMLFYHGKPKTPAPATVKAVKPAGTRATLEGSAHGEATETIVTPENAKSPEDMIKWIKHNAKQQEGV